MGNMIVTDHDYHLRSDDPPSQSTADTEMDPSINNSSDDSEYTSEDLLLTRKRKIRREVEDTCAQNKLSPTRRRRYNENKSVQNEENSGEESVVTEVNDSEVTEGPSYTRETTLVAHKRMRINLKPFRKRKRRRRSSKRRQNKVRYSETTRYRLLQTYIYVRDHQGKVQRVKAALDTQSNVSYTKRHLGTPREWRPHEGKIVRGLGGFSEETKPITTTIVKGDQEFHIDTRTPPKSLFSDPEGPELLLSAQHCAELKIDINQALKSLRHKTVTYLQTTPQKKPKRVITREICLIAEKIMEKYLLRTGGSDKEPKQCSIDDVEIHKSFSMKQRRQIKDICHRYRKVFASSPDEIPPPMKDATPHVFKMKKDVKPIYCKRPNWGPSQRKYLEQWTKKAIRQGLMEPAPNSQWASRPVLVGKYRGTTAKTDVPDGIRTCVDFTAVNEYIVKQPPQYTDPFEEIRKASERVTV